jgi:hypothetical protein
MMDEFKRWSKSYLLLLATYDEILSWLIEIWMKKYLVSNSNCKYNPPKKLQGMKNNVRITFSVGDTTPRFTIGIERDD